MTTHRAAWRGRPAAQPAHGRQLPSYRTWRCRRAVVARRGPRVLARGLAPPCPPSRVDEYPPWQAIISTSRSVSPPGGQD